MLWIGFVGTNYTAKIRIWVAECVCDYNGYEVWCVSPPVQCLLSCVRINQVLFPATTPYRATTPWATTPLSIYILHGYHTVVGLPRPGLPRPYPHILTRLPHREATTPIR